MPLYTLHMGAGPYRPTFHWIYSVLEYITVLHCCLAYLKVFGQGGYVRLGPKSQPNIIHLNQTILNLM